MPDVMITGFHSMREAHAFAKAIEFVNDSAIEVIEVADHSTPYVLLADSDQDQDLEIVLNLEAP